MIHIQNLEKKYASEFTLQIDELHIEKNDRVALVGANGSGKSTLLRLLSGYIAADQGDCIVSCEKNETGYEPQSPFCCNLSLRRNLELGIDRDNNNKKEIITRIMESFGLTHLAEHRPNALSGGEKQRMCLARMLVKHYRLLLLDEPLSAVDIELTEKLEAVLMDYCRQNDTTLLFSTHLPSQAVRISNKMIVMHKGRVVEFGNTADILRNPQTEFGKAFLNNWRIDKC
ncbi:MAG: ATP-binding cassette domain-containing protein [Clostridia bacterium]|nr:ATP-binding cassette domain-containing protein [Clostridia bacterium]